MTLNFDYIIVGCGLAGIAFAETCISNGKTVYVFDNNSQNSSTIAAGIYNPVIFKRFSGLEYAQEQLDLLNTFYQNIQTKLNSFFDFKTAVLRKFTSIEEQNNWFAASDKLSLSPFLSLNIYKKKFIGIESPFDFGQVLQTGFVDTQSLLLHYRAYLKNLNCYSKAEFNYKNLKINSDSIHYQNIQAKHIVFAEGFGIHANPYFNYLPLDGTKGEIIVIKAPDLQLDQIINSSLYIVPLGNHMFKIGATYNWADKTQQITTDGLTELTDKLNQIITCKYTIIHHYAGIRPTVKDRKPLLGTHITHNNMHIINGLGTRGVMLGPWCANKLFNSINNGYQIEKSLNINRFVKNL